MFVFGGLLVTESPRWLFGRGATDQARAALLRSRTPEQAAIEIEEMAAIAHSATGGGHTIHDSLLRRKYVIPFLLACVILFCNTATGVNSAIGYNTRILLQSGLNDLYAHWGYVIFTVVNFLATTIGMALIDRKGRRFLLIVGTSGIIASLLFVGLLFKSTEKLTVDVRDAVQTLAGSTDSLTFHFDQAAAARLLSSAGYTGSNLHPDHASLAIIYSYGDFTAATSFVRADDAAAAPIEITRSTAVPDNRVEALFHNPFGNIGAAQSAPLRIEKALLGGVPDGRHGWLVALGLYAFVAFYALGPGVCVWLALSELMPTRIRSKGMSIALVGNQMVSTTLAGTFLPFVSRHGYSSIFFIFAGFTVVYLVTAVFFLPETKGKTLEEIEAYFEARATS
jgi:MFS family permease